MFLYAINNKRAFSEFQNYNPIEKIICLKIYIISMKKEWFEWYVWDKVRVRIRIEKVKEK